MSGSDMDDLVEDQLSLIDAARENFNEETEVQEEDTSQDDDIDVEGPA